MNILHPSTLKTKTFWLGILTIASPFIPLFAAPKVAILAGAIVIALRDAITKLQEPTP